MSKDRSPRDAGDGIGIIGPARVPFRVSRRTVPLLEERIRNTWEQNGRQEAATVRQQADKPGRP